MTGLVGNVGDNQILPTERWIAKKLEKGMENL